MTLRHQKTILFVAGSLLWYAAGGLILHGLFGPVRVEPSNVPVVKAIPTGRDATSSQEGLPPLATFAAVWDLPLQQAVFDVPPPPPPDEAPPEPPPVNAKLLGTVSESNRRTAMLKLSSGPLLMLGEGETFDNAPGTVQIVEVRDKSVVVRILGFDETTVTLEAGK